MVHHSRKLYLFCHTLHYPECQISLKLKNICLWTPLDNSWYLWTILGTYGHLWQYWILLDSNGHLLTDLDKYEQILTPYRHFPNIPGDILTPLNLKHSRYYKVIYIKAILSATAFEFSFNKTPSWSTPGFYFL